MFRLIFVIVSQDVCFPGGRSLRM